MPYSVDKIRINGGGGGGIIGNIGENRSVMCGYDIAIDAIYASALMIAEEFVKDGWETHTDVLALLEKQVNLCAKIRKAQRAYIAAQDTELVGMQELVDQMSILRDRLGTKQPLPALPDAQRPHRKFKVKRP